MLSTAVNYTETINNIMPGAKIIKLTGYAKGNQEYQKAKTPVGSWKTTHSLDCAKIDGWLGQGGWIGCVVPKGIFIVDIDDSKEGQLLRELLEGENIHHHLIKTPNGWQFIFKDETNLTKKEGQYQNYVNRLGLTQDTRAAEKGYIVFPTENTEGRYLVTQSLEKLDELPQFLYKAWNGAKTPSPMSYPYETNGSRDGDFYDLARRLLICKVSKKEVLSSLKLAHKYFVSFKKGFLIKDITKVVNSAYKKVNEGKADEGITNDNEKKQDDSIIPVNIPSPYKVKNNALYRVETKVKNGELDEREIMVARHVPILKRELHNVERQQLYYELTWNDRGKVVTEIVPAGALVTKREMMPLADKGFPSNDNNIKQLIDYFDKVLAFTEIDRGLMVDRLGYVKSGLAHPLLATDYEILPNDQGEQQLFESFQVAGTVQGWIDEVFNRIKAHPRALFFVLSSFASVLLYDLKIDPFIVDLSSGTSKGKTSVLKVAASVWGTSELVNEFNATKVSIERKASFLNSFPLLMDDSRKADERLLQSIVYNFSGGKSKGRGSLSGSQRENTWKNIMLTTGEVSLNEYASKAGGAAARIVSLNDSPFEGVDYIFFADLYKGLETNYGVIGLEFLKQYQVRKKELLPSFYKFKDFYMNKAQGNEVLTRLSLYYATVHYAGRLLKEFFKVSVDLEQLDKLFDEIAQENKSIDKPKELLNEILTYLDSNRDGIYYDYAPKNIKAIYKFSSICLTPSFLKEFLGPEEKRTRKEWLKKGFTVPNVLDGKAVDYQKISHKGRKINAVTINKEIVQQLGFDFEENPPNN
ncbi:hypothetical protein IEQ_00175 [Bacillus cereus BAG6X1-2]|nr:hypothetical protein IEQ_00175 [Bacillus cereus BAG6X1-2]